MSISRRVLLKGFSVGSLLGAVPVSVRAATKRARGPYEELGITPVVNFQGTMTTLGASKMWEDLHEAAAQASREYVVLEELKDKIAHGVPFIAKNDSKGPTPPLYMPAWKDKIKGQELEDLATYLLSIKE